MRTYYLIAVLALLLFVSCEKEDKAYVLPVPGKAELAQVNMGENYDMQIYFRLEDKKQFLNHLFNWDLQFETGPSSFLARLNGGTQVQAFNTLTADFNTVFSISGINWQWDSPDGNPDSVVLRGWFDLTQSAPSLMVYLLDRGPVAGANRYKKLQLTSVSQEEYRFRFANLDGSEESAVVIPKDTAFNHIYFSFNDGGRVVQAEPEKSEYDVIFTRYRHIYFDLFPAFAYHVNGVLINPYHTSVSADSLTPFENIDYSFAKNMNFTSHWDGIGFDWKNYNFSNGLYEVNQSKSYVLKNQLGVYYKLRFIDFYTPSGIKGSPEFEFQRL